MEPTTKHTWRTKIHEIIYEADTPAGKFFDVVLLILIITSIILVMLESVNSIDQKYHKLLYIGEWFVTLFFSLEYILRVISVKKPTKYIFSLFGIIDFLSTIPMYIAFFFAGGTQALVVLRALRLLRIFRILKLARYLGASNQLKNSIIASRVKILVFLFAVMVSSIVFGTIMYLVEGEANGFTNIPKSVYWCIVTLTTVGFGDIAPQTALGQFITTIIMVLGYGIIAVPTGIVSAEYAKAATDKKEEKPETELKIVPLNTQSCSSCLAEKHLDGSKFCYKCGEALHHE